MSDTTTISRTAHITFSECPRKRYLSYEWNRGNLLALPSGETLIHIGGLDRQSASAPLLTGIAVHAGFTHLLSVLKQWEGLGPLIPWQEMRRNPTWHAVIRGGAGKALEEFDWAVEERGIDFGIDKGDAKWYEREQRALVEALVWVAGLRLVPELIGRYRVVDVEREERLPLAPKCATCNGTGEEPSGVCHCGASMEDYHDNHSPVEMVRRCESCDGQKGLRDFATRADALLEDRGTGDLSVFSLKTAAMYGRREEMRFRRDVQGLSEAIAIEHRLRAQQSQLEAVIMEQNITHSGPFPVKLTLTMPSVKVETVQMALLLKGIRRQSPTLDRKEHYSPLVRVWRMRDAIGGLDQWAWSYDTPKVNQKTGESYMGKLGKDWEVAQSWEFPGGVEGWVRALDNGEVQPEVGDPLLMAIALPEPWGRAETEMEDWLAQLRHSERQIEEGASVANYMIGNGSPDKAREVLNEYFPQNRHACVAFNSSCFADSICWGSAGAQVMAGEIPEGFAPRQDHHAVEEGEE